VFDLEGDYKRLSDDIVMLTTRAFPDYQQGSQAADAQLAQCRRVVTPGYLSQRLRRDL
jgi:hypothetical protein